MSFRMKNVATMSTIAFGAKTICLLSQGPLTKWPEHPLNLHLLKIRSRGWGAFITSRCWIGVDFLDHDLLTSLKAAQTGTFFDKFQILAAWSRAQKKHSTQFTKFSRMV